MKKYKYLLFAGLLALPFSFSSCKKYLDVNTNPNVAQDVPPSLLLTAGELGIGSAMGVDFEINGSVWAQYWTQHYSTSQYRSLERYQPTGNNYDNVWGLCYSTAMMDLVMMERKATALNLKQYVAVSKLLQAYLWQVMTDAWGSIPYSEALKGLPEDGGNVTPHYDSQESIYNGIIAQIKEAQDLIDPSDGNHPGDDDLIYHGDMSAWGRFSNSLLLKVYLRLSERAPGVAQAGIAAMSSDPGDYLGDGEDAQINYLSTSGNNNPLYSEIVGLRFAQNLAASATSIDSMMANEDERVTVLYTPAGGTFVGLRQGFYSVTTSPTISFPSAATGAFASSEASATAPVKFITGYESMLLQAEAIARGWMAGGTSDEEDLYNAAIEASFTSLGLDATDYFAAGGMWSVYPTAGSLTDRLKSIITQKWFCMNGTQGFEAWTEWRRTGYPNFFVTSVNSQLGAGQFPVRILYPNTELTRNPNFPGQVTVLDKVWWDN